MPKSQMYDSIRIFSETLFTSTNPAFVKQRRRILAPAFAIQYIASLEPLMKKTFEDVIEKIDRGLASAGKKGTVLDVYQLNNQWALDIIGETAFNGSFDMVKTGYHPLPQAIHNTLFKLIVNSIFPIFRLSFNKNLYIAQFAIKILEERRKQYAPRKRDILQQLLDSGLPDEDLVLQIIEFIVAGSDTTAYSATMALSLLVRHPEKLERLSKELESEFGFPHDSKIPDIEKLKKLPYLNAVINESLRIAPVSLDMATIRTATEDWAVRGHLIPKGTLLIANVYGLHHSTEYWGDDANEFKPERWLDPEKLPKDAFYPFSAGSRICIGMNFAIQELRMAITTFVYRYRMEEVPGQDLSLVQYIVPKIKSNQYKIRFFPKHKPKV